MKKLLLLSLVVLTSCSHDCPEPKFNPCDCLLVTDPTTWQFTDENGIITYNTYFVGKNECLGISEPMNFETTNINEIPKEFECFKQ
jgi:hypothetical protein